jgi:hypothetical protein
LMALAASAEMPQVRAMATFYLQQAKGRLDRAAGGQDVAAASHAGLLSRDIARFLDNPDSFKRPAPIIVPPGAPIGEPGWDWLGLAEPPCSLWDIAMGGMVRR